MMSRMMRNRLPWIASALVMATTTFAQPAAPPAEGDGFELLERQIRSVKSDLLSLEADMQMLEQDVLYPEAQRWTIFVSGPATARGRLYSLQISVNGTVVASHTYNETQSQALLDGGAHKIYTGALPAGTHRVGIQAHDSLGERQAAYQVEKAAGPQVLELQWTAQPDNNGFQAKSLADRS
jgi:hypothetical protein